MRVLDGVTLTLVIVGALNWGLVGVTGFDLVAAVFGMRFGEVSMITGLVYAVVGLSGLYQAAFFKNIQRRWTGLTLATP
jgi:uncharacterized membrane protein YuzA (DUF378 family)